MGHSDPRLVREQDADILTTLTEMVAFSHRCLLLTCLACGGSGSAREAESPIKAPVVTKPAAGRRCVGARSTAPPPTARTTGCAPLSEALRSELTPLFARETKGDDGQLRVTVAFPCSGVTPAPAEITGAQVFGHGGLASVVGLERAADGDFRFRMIRVEQRLLGERVDETHPPFEFVRGSVPAGRVARAFERMRTGLAARITAQHDPPPGQLELGPIAVSSASIMIELRLRDAGGAVVERGYMGYVGSADAAERVPVEHAWQAFTEAWPEEDSKVSHDAEPEDRLLLESVWSLGGERDFYAEDGLLALAIAAGSPPLVGPISRDLYSDVSSTRTLAVAALATITGWDARLDASGKPRPLQDVVADYKRECSTP